jgi:hypothetical protein
VQALSGAVAFSHSENPMNLAQNFAHLDAVSVASSLAAGALALTRLLTTAKPLWDRLPKSLQGLLPVLVLVLPQLAEQAAGVKTTLDLTNLLILAVAMILPGWHSHTVGGEKTGGPGAGAAVGLAFAFVLLVVPTGCTPEPKTVIKPCSTVELATIVAGCDARIRLECNVNDTSCLTYQECSLAIKNWRSCGEAAQ